MNRIVAALLFAAGTAWPLAATVPEGARTMIDRTIGGKGIYVAEEGVHKIVLPRDEATIVLDYQTLSPNLGLNSWAAFTSAIHQEGVLTGQFLLLEDEVNPVLTTALTAGLEVTGLAASSLFEGRALKTLDVTGSGTFQSLASSFRKGLDEIRRVRRAAILPATKFAPPSVPLESAIDPRPLDAILSMRGVVVGGVYKASIGRRVLLHGETIGREMGISSWITFAGTNDNTLSHGEFVATSDELQKLLKALRAKHVDITSIRNHMAGEHPQLLYVHFRAQGRSAELAKALRYALDVQVGTIAPPSSGEKL